jgi:diguanylate cyclase (GGDEF)-like protein
MLDRPKKILIVDDEPGQLEVLRMLLMPRGYDVISARGGEEALATASETRVDAIILDIMMPGIDGIQVKARLNQDSHSASIPVIFLTAQSAVEDKVRGLSIGADDYVTKPFHSEELIARLESALKRKGVYEDLAMTDGVTGLHNNIFFKKEFMLFFGMAKRYKVPFSLVLVDMDNLKQVNDMYGHAAGDFLLKNFASIARATFRSVDIVTRYGGDEFAIIIPESDHLQTKVAVDRLRNIINETILNYRDVKEKIVFSISAGVAAYDQAFNNESQMFDLADKRLYEEKKSKKVIR